jgi:hypothetical protein
VSWDDTHAQLSCDCPGWTQQTHFRNCGVTTGAKCVCRNRQQILDQNTPRSQQPPKDLRSCRHTREMTWQVARAGGINRALLLVASGTTLGENVAPRAQEAIRASRAALGGAGVHSLGVAPRGRRAAPPAPLRTRAIRVRDDE